MIVRRMFYVRGGETVLLRSFSRESGWALLEVCFWFGMISKFFGRF